ncbi:trimeric intracellular cation channel family protein [Sphingobium phenoxybenzoativorans]|uniref:Trimeric intracellular cation channel family protein n=1 Tax=Sphingobium phenoxybenzoativorans TaxID=1592790 RepID=A0A975K8E8_9SPHN|nr:trimeric intracellular cation channel family protein [Sphingobium phenoxybenzoativorans]QUT06274.1 trimeric intracellular cation channel family protein [Sphingobium phenoxybenzoativorans]
MAAPLPVPDIGIVLEALSLVGTFVFAASGALAAARLRLTLITFAFFALVTGAGGGTVRDLLIGAPVFWVIDPVPAMVCMIAALLVWITPQKWWSARALDWLDAVGLAAFAVFGAAKALSFGIHPFVAAMMGVVTGCVGGIIRDLLAGEPSILLRPELYVTAATLAAGLFVLLIWAGMALPLAAAIASVAGFALRAAAIARGLALPPYRAGS